MSIERFSGMALKDRALRNKVRRLVDAGQIHGLQSQAIFVGALLLIFFGFVGAWSIRNYQIINDARVAARFEVAVHVDRLRDQLWGDFRVIERQLRVGAASSDVRNFVDAPDNSQRMIVVLADNVPSLYQARILGMNGVEVLRLERSGESLDDSTAYSFAGGDDLQDKSDRYYFQRTVTLKENQVYVSPLDLNVENGVIEEPWRPTVRFASPIYTESGDVQGILVLNIDMTGYLEPFNRPDVAEIESYLLNGAGFLLAGGDGKKRWAFMTENNAELKEYAPALWELVDNALIDTPFEHENAIYEVSRLSIANTILDVDLDNIVYHEYDDDLIIYATKDLPRPFTSFDKPNIIYLCSAAILSIIFAFVIVRFYEGRVQHALQVRQNLENEFSTIQRMASLGRIVAGVSHELRTPIGNAQSATSTLQEKINEFKVIVQSGVIKKSVLEKFVVDLGTGAKIITHNIDRSVKLISHFKKTAADQSDQQRNSFVLCDVLRDLTQSIRPEYDRKLIEIEFDCTQYIEMNSYAAAIDQVVLNLVENASKHAFETAQTTKKISIKVFEADSDEDICIEVADNGTGIDPKIIDRIFEPFWTSKRSAGGTGLGLSIVANVVEHNLGGSISVTSYPKEGTRFSIVIPRSFIRKTTDPVVLEV